MPVADFSIGPADARRTGSYYTPATAADLMASWAIRKSGDRVLEPCFGDGVFIDSIDSVAAAKNLQSVIVHGVEMSEGCHGRAASRSWNVKTDLLHGDFLATTQHFPVDAVIGNPPYVRIRHLDQVRMRNRALHVAREILGQEMDPSGSLWMPFVLHSVRHLRVGGRMTLVLPYELTYVRYARPLWRFLAEHFSALKIVRVRERLFPDLLQEAVLLFADGHGGHTEQVEFEAYESVADLAEGKPASENNISVDSIVRGERRFMESLLGAELRDLLNGKIFGWTAPAASMVTFNIGYVAGDKKFFHPEEEVVRAYGLLPMSLHPALTSSRQLRGAGLFTSSVAATQHLFLPAEPEGRPLTPGERAYVKLGEEEGVDQRFKCRVRKPWYRVPYVKTPDLVLSVFSSTPLLMLNDAATAASNSLLCGYTHGSVTAEQLAARWYTSLTLLECELRVHSLGGGVLIIVPGEAGAIRLPIENVNLDKSRINRELKAGRVRAAYQAGDKVVLGVGLGLTFHEIELIREGVETLRRWRERSATPKD